MHLVIVRPLGNVLDVNSYNCQEIGLAKALVNDGWCVSVIMAGLQNEHIRVKCIRRAFCRCVFFTICRSAKRMFVPRLEKIDKKT